MPRSVKRWPWLTSQDAELLADWRELDPASAAEYERHLHNESYSNQKFWQNTVSLEELTEDGRSFIDKNGHDAWERPHGIGGGRKKRRLPVL